ncbi:hypothetical protein B0T26DRAFT_533905 [Lasiosphaeria miniovina]|uniref:Uncharacterized protein n=1 Tax=Lasiosphaeria miniovina TaxID=1954250 RepID=A0AA39ZQP5_9PEZI|nr:uncharacterized protein B0T26DRAFT_533905 [Lasiosphaeria miniovina]KAK0701843.1 hypothetical protein B0T26DRAFT_533905 [Lasiosphaeria miniovina]
MQNIVGRLLTLGGGLLIRGSYSLATLKSQGKRMGTRRRTRRPVSTVSCFQRICTSPLQDRPRPAARLCVFYRLEFQAAKTFMHRVRV